MRVADYIIDYIYKKGTDTVFMLSGGGAMYLNDATACHKKIRYICSHHEQASAMAAEAYAKTKGIPGAVIVTSGPGSTNTITGLLEAWQNSIPVIFLSSQSKISQMSSFTKPFPIRQFGTQEMDIISVVKPLTKYSSIVENPNDIKYHLERAYHEMLNGRPGPVWLDIPSDVCNKEILEKTLKGYKNKEIKYCANKNQIDSIINSINKSKKPIIIAGGGIRLSGSINLFRKLVDKLNIPVVVPDMGIDILEFKNPKYIGHGGTKGDRAANIVIQNSDLIISIGSRLAVPFIGHEYQKWAPNAKIIVIDIDKNEHQKNTIKIDEMINSDAKDVIEKLLYRIKTIKTNLKWLKKCQKIKKKYCLYLPENTTKKVNMYYAIDAISRYSSPGDHFITDAGITAYITTQTLKIKKNQRLIIPGATLTMGYNLPAILGVWASNPKTKIICITGDGSFQMNIHELATIFYHKINTKIFVINNNGYLAIRTTQKNFFEKRLIGEGVESGVSMPNIEKIVKAYGLKYFGIDNINNLKTIKKIINYKGPAVCEITCPYWQDILTVSSKKDDKGKMMSLPIDNMYPFLSQSEMDNISETLK